jgi:hypothetical protein
MKSFMINFLNTVSTDNVFPVDDLRPEGRANWHMKARHVLWFRAFSHSFLFLATGKLHQRELAASTRRGKA